MDRRLLACSASATLEEVGAALARHEVRVLLVDGEQANGKPRILSDADLVAALARGVDAAEATADAVAEADPVLISESETLRAAARLLSDRGVGQLLVVGSGSQEPVGIVSSTEIARGEALFGDGRDVLSIVAAHDGAAGGDDAVALARVLGGRRSETLVTIVVPFPPRAIGDPPLHAKPGARTWDELCDDLRKQAEARLESRAGRILDGLEHERRVVLDDSPARGLAELCEQERPDLLVVGPSHRSGIGHRLAGGTVDRLLNGSPAPVAIAPAGYAERDPDPPREIGVGFDGSPSAIHALDLAARLAERHSADLRVFAIVSLPAVGEKPHDWPGAPPDLGGADRQAEWLRRVAHEELERHALRPPTKVEISYGDPADVLLGVSGWAVDLLVVGSRGYGPIRRVLVGSVSHRLAIDADCPVVVAPRR
jgi:nucleotide-binding universal stress UspA family protein